MQYAGLAASLTVCLTGAALMARPWGYSLLWFALCAAGLTIGYARPGTNLFRKRRDGTIPAAVRCVFLPLFLYVWSTWNLVRCLSREPPFNRVTDDLLIGRRLLAGELPAGVHNYLDLTMEFEEPAAVRRAVPSYTCLPILNGGVPRPETVRGAFERLEAGTTYIHCARGHGRTALAALCLLAHRNRITTLEEGRVLLQAVRPGIHLNAGQKAFVKAYLQQSAAGRPSA